VKRRGLYLVAGVGLAVAAVALLWPRGGDGPDWKAVAPGAHLPRVHPDIAGVTIPPNVAPLNFVVDEPGEAYAVRISGGSGDPVLWSDHSASVAIPPQPWRALLEANRGGELRIEVAVRGTDGPWVRFAPMELVVANEPIDGYLVYRRLGPIYNLYRNMGIYQMNLETAEESCVLDNKSIGNGCVNCHTFCGNAPSRMVLHVRQKSGPAMILVQDGAATKVDTRTAFHPSAGSYSAWHPDGRLLAFSVNSLSQFFKAAGETRDVFDSDSALGLYSTDTNTVTTAPALSDPDRLETWPAWSPDGRYLYFSSAPKLPAERFREVRYDLVRAAFDPEKGEWGNAETLLSARETGLSITEPRVSPDGRWILFTMSEYGNFPIYQPSSDLYLMDLGSRRWWRLECNSDRCDSFHSWSSNSRWIVFSSKRRDGLFARPHFAYVDASGHTRKPFVMPQREADFYDSCVKNYNAPELIKSPVTISEKELAVAASKSAADTRKAMLAPSVPVSASPSATTLNWSQHGAGDKAAGPTSGPAEAYCGHGVALRMMGQPDAAIKDLDKAIELKADYAEAYYNRGVARSMMGQIDAAIKDLDKAIALKADYAEAYYNRGVARGMMGQIDAAIADYDRAIGLKADYMEAYINRGAAYGKKGQFDAAIRDFDKTVELRPDCAAAYHNRAVVHSQMKAYDKAWADVETCRKLGGTPDPEFIEFLTRASGQSK
jgi:tetratricopeptide (TPR) repeat protein